MSGDEAIEPDFDPVCTTIIIVVRCVQDLSVGTREDSRLKREHAVTKTNSLRKEVPLIRQTVTIRVVQPHNAGQCRYFGIRRANGIVTIFGDKHPAAMVEVDGDWISDKRLAGHELDPESRLDLEASLRLSRRFWGLRRLINPVPSTSLVFNRLHQFRRRIRGLQNTTQSGHQQLIHCVLQ
jgi:hypothetical protein